MNDMLGNMTAKRARHQYQADREIAVAPMMDCTDRHCRMLHRLINPDILLYTEMITSYALLYGEAEHLLDFDAREHPVALQLGGSEPDKLARCAEMARAWGYDEVNLNCGCPSDRVQQGRFGVTLMREPELVARCVSAMQTQCDIAVTVKCRIGVDTQDSLEFLERFVSALDNVGCPKIIIHARKAWLKGLSPKENREKPPLNYDRVYAIKQRFPHLKIIMNGGFEDRAAVDNALSRCDGVMLGRAAYKAPYILADITERPAEEQPTRVDIALKMADYIQMMSRDYATPWRHITRHMLGLFHGLPGGKRWRQFLSETHAAHYTYAHDYIGDALAAMDGNRQQEQISGAHAAVSV
jgi:tRNA-dihydrouridine synthase A